MFFSLEHTFPYLDVSPSRNSIAKPTGPASPVALHGDDFKTPRFSRDEVKKHQEQK
jgi:hypothetical protein